MKTTRAARAGTLVLGGGFGGAHLARLLGKDGATIVSPDSSMLYTPLLPEVAAGAIEARHALVPLRMMCPEADIVRGRAVALDEESQIVCVETEVGELTLSYERLVIALGAVPRMPAIPGLDEHALPFKSIADAIALRSRILSRVDLAEADPASAERRLTFTVVGGGYAGVEAIAELTELVRDAIDHYPSLQDVPQRWVLVDAGAKILSEVPNALASYTHRQLERRGVDIRLETTVESVSGRAVQLSDGSRLATETVVWAAGITPNPLLRKFGLPLDGRGRLLVDETLAVEGRRNLWALGDCARVPNAATPERPDPPTCQHALRQARALARTLRGRARTYSYRSLGQGATLGRDRGIAVFLGVKMRGRLGAGVTRLYHVQNVPLLSRRLRVLADGVISHFSHRDIAEIPLPTNRRFG